MSVLLALEAAVRADEDGAAFMALVHPVDGAMLWYPAAEMEPPAILLAPGDDRSPGDVIAAVVDSGWHPGYLREVAAGLAAGLAHRDRDATPSHYHDRCDDQALPRKGTLTVGLDLDLEHLGGNIADQYVPTPYDEPALFRYWGLEVYLARERGRWWVTHVVVWEPCNTAPRLEMPRAL